MDISELLGIASVFVAAGLGLGELLSVIKRGVNLVFGIIKF